MTTPNPEQELKARTRRGFLGLAAGAAGGVGVWSWLQSREPDEGVPYPFRRVLQMNEKLWRTYFSADHHPRQYPVTAVAANPRKNGDVGLSDDWDPAAWRLTIKGSTGEAKDQLTLKHIQSLPKVEQVTELNCIEGWTQIVHWGGARFSDFTARYAPQSQDAPYIGMQTPDEEYYVGLDRASAMHPQTLLCYEMNGQPLSKAHGAPLRLVIPVKYGIKNIKRIGTITYSAERPEDYWATEGYDWYAGL